MKLTLTRWPGLLAVLAALCATGCVEQPLADSARGVAVEPAPLPPPPSTQVIFYPNAGQSAEQQDRDRYECYRWSVQQTGFDPAAPQVAPHQRVQVVAAAPPGINTASGAVTGAVLGAAVSNPRNAGGGALIGAIAGAMLGAAADSANAEQTRRIQQSYDSGDANAAVQMEQQATRFRRAMSACLGGRGYTVQ
jgi:outer membrane lipoprotein SlyB